MKRILMTIAALVAVSGTASAGLVYQLDAGSNITLFSNGNTYDLTGGFTWDQLDPPSTSDATFVATGLSFVGGPISIVLHTADPQTQGSITFAVNDPDRCLGDICKTFFGALVDVNVQGLGLFESFTFSLSGEGDYVGDFTSPFKVSYTDLLVAPAFGGASIARLNFSATLVPVAVPEPNTLWLLLTAIIFCAMTQLSRWRAFQQGRPRGK